MKANKNIGVAAALSVILFAGVFSPGSAEAEILDLKTLVHVDPATLILLDLCEGDECKVLGEEECEEALEPPSMEAVEELGERSAATICEAAAGAAIQAVVAEFEASSTDIVQGETGKLVLNIRVAPGFPFPVTVTVNADFESPDAVDSMCGVNKNPQRPTNGGLPDPDEDALGGPGATHVRQSTEYTVYPEFYNTIGEPLGMEFDSELTFQVYATPSKTSASYMRLYHCEVDIDIIPYSDALDIVFDKVLLNGLIRAIPPGTQVLVFGKCIAAGGSFIECGRIVPEGVPATGGRVDDPLLLVGPTDTMALTAVVERSINMDGGSDTFSAEYYLKNRLYELGGCSSSVVYEKEGDSLETEEMSYVYELHDSTGNSLSEKICYRAKIYEDDPGTCCDDHVATRTITIWVKYENVTSVVEAGEAWPIRSECNDAFEHVMRGLVPPPQAVLECTIATLGGDPEEQSFQQQGGMLPIAVQLPNDRIGYFLLDTS